MALTRAAQQTSFLRQHTDEMVTPPEKLNIELANTRSKPADYICLWMRPELKC